MNITETIFPGKRGVLCLTYDDRHLDLWLAAMPVFRKYDAHATFFFCREIDAKAIETMKALRGEGHTVGLHTLTHADAPEYFDKNGAQAYLDNEVLPQYNACMEAGIAVKSFAYPNNRRTEETDRALSPYFRHFRAGLGAKRPEGIPLNEYAPMFRPVSELPGRTVMGGAGIGSYYNTDIAENLAVLQKACDEEQVVVFFSHDIAVEPSRIGTSYEILEAMLEKASELGMAIVGFDQLP